MENEKNQVLLTLLKIRHEELSSIRERQWKVITSSVVVFFLVASIVIQGKSTFPLFETLGIILAILIFWIAILMVLSSLSRVYGNSFNTLQRIEDSLKLYDSGYYREDGESIYPESWKKPFTGKPLRKFSIILSIFALLSIMLLVTKLLLGKT